MKEKRVNRFFTFINTEGDSEYPTLVAAIRDAVELVNKTGESEVWVCEIKKIVRPQRNVEVLDVY